MSESINQNLVDAISAYIGRDTYEVVREKVRKKCDYCCGLGVVEASGNQRKCLRCDGEKWITTDGPAYVVKWWGKIFSVRLAHFDSPVKVSPGKVVYRRYLESLSENSINACEVVFASMELAQEYADDSNAYINAKVENNANN